MVGRKRRRAPAVEYSSLRWAVSILARVHEHQSCPLDVRIVDISASGCRLWAGFRMTPGCPARVLIPGTGPVRACVVWSRDGQAALRFQTPLHDAVLRHIVASHPPDPDGPEWSDQARVATSMAPSWP